MGDGTGTSAHAVVRQDLACVLNSLGVGVFALDLHERIVWANTASLTLLSCSAGDVVGRGLRTLIYSGARQAVPPRATDEDTKVPIAPPGDWTWLVRGDGSPLEVRCFALPITSGPGNGIRLLAFDTAQEGPVLPALPLLQSHGLCRNPTDFACWQTPRPS